MKKNTINPSKQNECIFDLLPEASPTLQTEFKKQQPIKQETSITNTQDQTDKYGFKSQKELKQKNDPKTLNARIQKWRIMIDLFDKQEKPDKKLLKNRTRKGIPDGFRNLAWPYLAGVPQAKIDSIIYLKCGKYEEFLKSQEFNFEHQIRLDVLRTFPDNVNFQDQTVLSESLVNVLKALSVAISDMGYCQGLNFLTAALIMVTNDENAFWILFRLMTKYQQAEKYKNPSSLLREFFILDCLINQYYPTTAKILKKNNIDLFYFATEWFITLFASTLPIDLFYRVFEIFLLEGEKTLFRCALAIIHFKEQKLIQLQNNFEISLRHLKSLDDFFTIDNDQFIYVMFNKFKFSWQLIQQLEEKYKKQKKK
ncbi:unnamed protein product [Paramecium octaurelia]|uniref:Rab-GAP TBC domain-containing protein n=1 Tax=Paramecium octaurelia TaxID=43137 RepID=A0A8S1VRM1_PAROT|nr:unnamed protein product [Paramecium octaurelia]